MPAGARPAHINRHAPARQGFGFEQAGNGLDPHLVIAGLSPQHVGDAARGVAACLRLGSVRVADAHQDLRARMTRRLQQDHLVTTDAGPPVGQRACRCRIDSDCSAAAVEHDKIVAQAVHLQERDLAHWRQVTWRPVI